LPRQVGLKDIHIALLTTDSLTETVYETPTKLERAVSAKITPKTNSENIYSDDAVEDVLNSFEGVEVEIELNQLSLLSRSIVQGAKVVKGILIENKDDLAPTLAMGFKSKKSNGKYRYVLLLKGKFEITADEFDTEADKPDAKTAKLTGTFYPRDFDGNYRFIVDEDSEGIDQAVIDSWFTSVPDEPVIENESESESTVNEVETEDSLS
jgi:phi13 family phage major tail protein